MIDYENYTYTKEEAIKYFLMGLLLSSFIAILFYKSIWAVLLFSPFALFFLKFMKEKKKRRKNALYCGSILLGVDLWYLMTCGNMQDYKRVIVCSVLWTLVILVWLTDIHKQSVSK